MLSGLQFQTTAPATAVSPDRTDIACFIGYVGRRSGSPLPDEVQRALRIAGWVKGPWQLSQARMDTLENVPLAVESFDSFARLFEWEGRPLRDIGAESQPPGGTRDTDCATYLGAAVRSFFADGGRRAIVIRVADPFPFLESAGGRVANRSARLHNLVPAYADTGIAALPFDPTDPRTWRGIEHLYGLPEVSHVCLPDLPDICAVDPQALPTAFEPPPPPEVFVPCTEGERAPPGDTSLRRLFAPRSDDSGFAAWQRAVSLIRDFLARQRRDVLFAAALPLPLADARHDDGVRTIHAQKDFIAFLLATGVLESTADLEATAGRADPSAFVQLLWPWLRTNRSDDLPESIEPPDGVFAGLLARNALVRGTFRSVGGTVLDDVIGLTPLPAMGLGPDGPTDRLAERVCVFATEPDGNTLVSDVTSTADVPWRFGGTRRLIAAILRSARRFGENHAFEPNGPALWSALRRSLEDMLTAFWLEGAFGGASTDAAYSVRCDASTMSQNDLDNGRLIAMVSVVPAAAISRITVVLDMTVDAAGRAEVRQVA